MIINPFLVPLTECDLDRSEKYRCTPLYAAAKEGHVEVVRRLVDAGADLNKANTKACTPFLGQFKLKVVSPFDLTILELSHSKKEKKNVLDTVTHQIRTYNTQIQNPWGEWSPLMVTYLLDDLLDDLMIHLSWYPGGYSIHW